MPAFLDHGALKDLVVKAGSTARWQVKIGGKPAPTVKWAKQGKVLETGAQLQIDTKKSEHTILCSELRVALVQRRLAFLVPSTVRADCGSYVSQWQPMQLLTSRFARFRA